jgi:hypothetical protein
MGELPARVRAAGYLSRHEQLHLPIIHHSGIVVVVLNHRALRFQVLRIVCLPFG